MSDAADIQCVMPSRLGVGETFRLKVKVLGAGPVEIPAGGQWNHRKPQLSSVFNLNVCRDIRFMDNCLPEWEGRLVADGGPDLEGPSELVFRRESQGVFPNDTRPIKFFPGFRWLRPGFHFLKLTEPESGLTVSANPVCVTEGLPKKRIFWGDPHWQTFFSDGIRCPEELYAFARDEGFLDFGAISDHMEAVTDRQWDYFQLVTDHYNRPHRFVTLHGQEWTHHLEEGGAPGHRNVYFRKAGGPALRCTDKDCNSLEKLWKKLCKNRHLDPVAIPHHTSNTVMGVDWEQGWNAEFEKAVEIYSVWGSSELPEKSGNTRPIRSLEGEKAGRHVVDALNKGYRFGFVGGGDIHDGRPGDDLHNDSYPVRNFQSYPQGFTAAFAPALTRSHIFDAIKNGKTYATTKKRIYLDIDGPLEDGTLEMNCASEEGIRHIVSIRNGVESERIEPDTDPRIVRSKVSAAGIGPGEYMYFRLVTEEDNMAWTSPIYG